MKLADILKVSLDGLADRKEPSPKLKTKNYELHRLCQQCDDLPDDDQQVPIGMIGQFSEELTHDKGHEQGYQQVTKTPRLLRIHQAPRMRSLFVTFAVNNRRSIIQYNHNALSLY